MSRNVPFDVDGDAMPGGVAGLEEVILRGGMLCRMVYNYDELRSDGSTM